MTVVTKTRLHPGEVVFRWTVIEDTYKLQNNARLLKCSCSCGVEKEVNEENMLRGLSKSCGCYSVDFALATKGIPKRRKNRVGNQIGDFTITGLREPKLNKEASYFGECQNGHRRILTRNFINHPENATCWCRETNTIKRYRKKKDYSIQEVADGIRYSRQAVQMTETKPDKSSNLIIKEVGEYLDVPQLELKE